MRTAVFGMDIICERVDSLVIAGIVLKCYLSEGIALSAGNVDNIAAQWCQISCGVYMLHELSDTALIVESFALYLVLVTLIREDYLYASVKESLFTQSSEEYIIVVNSILEDLAVSLESNACTCLGGIADDLEFLVVFTSLEALEVDMLAVLYGKLQPFRQRIYNGSANAVETA